jgi:DnaJ-class molecular chaperone
MQKPPVIIKNVEISLEQSFSGCTVPIQYDRWKTDENVRTQENVSMHLNIPVGIDNSDTIVLAEQGHVGNGIAGDVKLVFTIQNSTPFVRMGLDLSLKQKISLKEALSGFSFELKHINGKTLQLNNHTSRTIISPNFKKVIPGLGMTRENTTGNLIIEFDVVFPESLTPEQMDAIANIL